jgi:hypothetical protein
MPFDSSLWNVPTWASKRAYFVPEQAKLSLRLDAFNGSRVSSKERSKYGLYTVAAQPDASVGAVTQVRRPGGRASRAWHGKRASPECTRWLACGVAGWRLARLPLAAC